MTPQHRYNIIAHDGHCIAQIVFYNCGVNYAGAEAMKVVKALGAWGSELAENDSP